MTQPASDSSSTPLTPSADSSNGRFSTSDSGFTVDGVSFHPVSSNLTIVRLTSTFFVVAVAVIVLIVAALVINGSTPPWPTWLTFIPAILIGVVGIGLLAVVHRHVRSIGWAEGDEELFIRRGVLFRSLSVVPYGRLQFIDVKQGPIDRALGIATVQLHTASASSDATVPGILIEDATALRERLSQRGKSRMAGL